MKALLVRLVAVALCGSALVVGCQNPDESVSLPKPSNRRVAAGANGLLPQTEFILGKEDTLTLVDCNGQETQITLKSVFDTRDPVERCGTDQHLRYGVFALSARFLMKSGSSQQEVHASSTFCGPTMRAEGSFCDGSAGFDWLKQNYFTTGKLPVKWGPDFIFAQHGNITFAVVSGYPFPVKKIDGELPPDTRVELLFYPNICIDHTPESPDDNSND